jgi:hypothetical protein
MRSKGIPFLELLKIVGHLSYSLFKKVPAEGYLKGKIATFAVHMA